VKVVGMILLRASYLKTFERVGVHYNLKAMV
jgi:hypothetical protein